MLNLSESIGNSETPNLGGDSDPDYKDYYYRLAESINFYGLSLIIPFGLIGNCFSICVLLMSSLLRRTTTGQYLIALAFADSTVLIGDGIRWLAYRRYSIPEYYFPQNLGLNVFDTSNAACKITNFLRYGGCFWSVWITIAIAVERLIAVAFPHKIDHFSTMKRTRIAIVCVVAVSFCLGSFPFWTLHVTGRQETNGVNMTRCVIYDKHAYDAWNNAVIKLGTLLIPGVLITMLTTVVIVLLCRNRNRQRHALKSEESTRTQIETPVVRLELSVEAQITIMLVALCVATISLRTPYTIAYYIRSRVWDFDVHPVTDVQTYMAYRITDMINTINYAINFVLYCVWGMSFRREAKRIFCRGREASDDAQRLATDDVCLNEMQNIENKSAGKDA